MPDVTGPVGPTSYADTRTVFGRPARLHNRATGRQQRVITRDRWIGKRLKWHFEWKLPDLWIGVFWRSHREEIYGAERLLSREIWICLLPCLPLCITTYAEDVRGQNR